jgi:hypothetical protein
MAIAHAETQVTWSAANKVAIAGTSNDTSDEVTIADTTVEAMITCMAEHSTTDGGGAGDDVSFYILYSGIDVDQDSSNDSDTTGHAILLGTVELDVEDPAIFSVPIPTAHKKFKIYAENDAGEQVMVAARMVYVTA